MLEKFIGQYHPWLKEHLRKIQEHPCYDPSARHLYGRVHLPVAPVCNIGCNYCIREFDCVHETRPGVTSRILTPEEALKKLEVVVETYPGIRVLGIAGPGEPLANVDQYGMLGVYLFVGISSGLLVRSAERRRRQRDEVIRRARRSETLQGLHGLILALGARDAATLSHCERVGSLAN